MFPAGVICIFAAWIKPFGLPDYIAKPLESIGITILTGGVFAILLKSFQFNNVFKEELKDVIYGDKKTDAPNSLTLVLREELNEVVYGTRQAQGAIVGILQEELGDIIYGDNYLKGRKDIEHVWRRVSRVLYKSKFREISDKIESKILKMYLPTEVNFYYDTLKQYINIRFHSPDRKFIEVNETFIFTIKAVDTSPIELHYRSVIKKDPSDTTSEYKLLKLEIDKVDQLSSCQIAPPEVKGEELISQFSLTLKGDKEYKVELEHKKIYDLDKDNTRVFIGKRFANTLELYAKYPRELEVAFFPIGTPDEETFEPKPGSGAGLIWKEYKHLMFPNQGGICLFSVGGRQSC